MSTVVGPSAIGASLDRIEARDKVTGQAKYAYEFGAENVAYAVAVQSTVAKGEVVAVEAPTLPGLLAVISHENAPALEPVPDGELALLQSPRVAYRGQVVAVVVADSLEVARDAAAQLRVRYTAEPHDVVLRDDHPGLYKPEKVNGNYETDSVLGDAEAALARAAVTHDATYTTPAQHNNPMEPHASLAHWHGGGVTIHDSNQGAAVARDTIAKVFGLEPEQVRVLSPHVGGGFGSKGTPRPVVILAALAARHVDRPVKLAMTRQQQFSLVGYRTPTIQRIRLGADADGRLTAIVHEAYSQSSTVREFTEQTTTPTRVMYAAADRRTTHRLTRLDVPTPSWMRAPGETPGMFALESAMDELAQALSLDPIELRLRNEPDADPENGKPWSSRHVVACLREGAERFGWAARAARREGRHLTGMGVACSTYPAYRSPAQASARDEGDGTFTVRVAAADIGTGARTALTQIAADALETGAANVHVEIGDSALPRAGVAGGSMGTASWGSAVHKACRALREGGGTEAHADTADDVKAQEPYSRHAFGAQFAEVRVDADTGEVRVTRLLGVFAVGRIINPKTARSQFIGAMTMGLGMALLEEGVMDVQFGDYVNHDLAGYHVAACADVESIEVVTVAEDDPHLNPMGSKGIGEIGIVGTAAAIANAVHHATGVRVRDLPIHLEDLLQRA
jgi:xanthine dehydrogenase YagR molybdenum-binding subunit